IVKDPNFRDGFRNERFFFGLLGPLVTGDDNFITRWVARLGYKIRITNAASIETTLGQFPKYVKQCLRWRRTTIQTASILSEYTLWLHWPWTTWTTYIPSLFNLALFWDLGLLYALTQTRVFLEARNPGVMVVVLGTWIYFAKLVKLFPYFRRYPMDFFLFFFPIPAYHCFAYFHSLLTLWAYCTFWDCSWSGRNL
ncbi:hypothetical protein B0T21DRAFT_271312, partial [Apiosordaria backusii]